MTIFKPCHLPVFLITAGSVTLALCQLLSEVKSEPITPQEKKSTASNAETPPHVLYVTHEPGKYHDYTAQRKEFEALAKENHWNLTVMSAGHDELIRKIAQNLDFGKQADLIVYNICMAKCDNLLVPHHIIRQTKQHKKPALLIHCALHSFWPTYKESNKQSVHATGAHKKARTRPELLAQWQQNHPTKPFPSWPTYTGFASTKHTPRGVVKCSKILKDHPILKDIPDYDTNNKAELYNNFIGPEDKPKVISILKGNTPKAEAVMLWEHQVQGTKVISFTLGHSNGEWRQKPFLDILKNTVHYLHHHP